MYSVSRKKNVPNIIDCYLKKGYPFLLIFSTDISGTTGHQMIIQYSASVNVCFCTTWGKQPMKYELKWMEICRKASPLSIVAWRKIDRF